MKTLRPNFHKAKQIAAVGFLTAAAVAGIFLLPAVYAGQAQGPPPWVKYELSAINLYNWGNYQEVSDPQGALKTLRQAYQESTDAIVNGGGSSPAVLHNDQLIGQALARAQQDAAAAAAKTPQTQHNQARNNQNENQNTTSQRSGGNKLARPGSNHNSNSMAIVKSR